MAAEQAESSALAADGMDDLADFLSDTPETESTAETDDTTADDSTDELDNEPEATDEQDTEDDESEDENADPAPVATKPLTFKVKGEDGTEETVEIKPEDIPGAFLRQRDYTVKTQALAQRENQAVQLLQQRHEELRGHYLQQAEVTRAAVVNMAGIRSDQELAELAQTDPAAWVAENQRQQSINRYLSHLDNQIGTERQHAQQQQTQAQQQHLATMYQTAWTELSKDGIDKPKLQKIYGDASKAYGFTPEELGNVYDHRLVKALRDAAAYRDLKAQKSAVIKKIAEAPRLPNRQSSPTQTRIDKATENRFKTGRARLDDLARLLA